MFTCHAVDLDFVDTAPKRLHAAVKVGRPPSEVFAAFAHDPANWGEFFPGFVRIGAYHTPGPHGVGSRCTKRVTGICLQAGRTFTAARFAVSVLTRTGHSLGHGRQPSPSDDQPITLSAAETRMQSFD